MLAAGDITSGRRVRLLAWAAGLFWLIAPAGAAAPTLDERYARAAATFAAGGAEYEAAAAAVIARGDEAVAFLTAKLAAQAERVGRADDVEPSGIRVTINLLGRMNSFPAARSALTRLKRHPVAEVTRWAGYALVVVPKTQPARRAPPTTTAPATRPNAAVDGNKVLLPDGSWLRRRRPKKPAPQLPAEVTKAFVIEIHGPIGLNTADAVERKIVKCKGRGAELVIFDMNTPGGRGDAMSRIVRLIMDDLAGIYSVAFINPEAYSAGAIISLACDEIVLAPKAIIGDAMPILITREGGLAPVPEAEREKIESGARAEMRMIAAENGYNVALCEAMVTRTLEVWKVQNNKGEVRFVEATEGRRYVIGAPAEGPAQHTPAADGPWEYVDTVDSAKELLTMTGDEAVALGFAEHVVADLAALKKHYGVAEPPKVLGDKWSERAVDFLSSPAAMALLMFVAMLCAYVEMHTPGFGVAGTVAIICFAVFVGNQFLSGMANYLEIGLLVLGLVLLAVEIFVTPGFGVAGVAGILCCLAALLSMLVANSVGQWPLPTTALDWELFSRGLFALVCAFVAGVFGAAILARYLPKVPVAGRLVLSPPLAVARPPASEDAEILSIRAGQTGTVVQICRPVGKVRIAGKLCDAIAEGAFLPADTAVVVLRNEGNRIVVEAKKKA